MRYCCFFNATHEYRTEFIYLSLVVKVIKEKETRYEKWNHDGSKKVEGLRVRPLRALHQASVNCATRRCVFDSSGSFIFYVRMVTLCNLYITGYRTLSLRIVPFPHCCIHVVPFDRQSCSTGYSQNGARTGIEYIVLSKNSEIFCAMLMRTLLIFTACLVSSEAVSTVF